MLPQQAQTKEFIPLFVFADNSISATRISAKLLLNKGQFLGLRDFGIFYKVYQLTLYREQSPTLTKLIYPFIIPTSLKTALN